MSADSPGGAASDAAQSPLVALQALEQQLEREWQGLHDRGFRYAQVLERLAEPKGRDRVEGAGRGAEVESNDWLAEACAAQAEFLSRLNDFQRVKQVYFMQTVTAELERALASMDVFYGPRRLRHVRWAGRRLQQLEVRYRSLESLWGTPQDHRRIAVFQKFYAGVIAFSKRIHALDPTAPKPPRPGLADRAHQLVRGARRGIRRAGDAWRALSALGSILWLLFGPRAVGRAATPVTRPLDRLFRALGRLRSLDVEITGERLPAAAGEITLYAPTHREGYLDNIAFSHLEVPDYYVFNAVDQLRALPSFLRDRAARTPGLIPVGPGRGSSIDRLLEKLAQGEGDLGTSVCRNVLIYPEGSVSEGFKGTRPPRERFGEGLVRRLREAGHSLRIVPVAYLDNARFLDLPPRSREPAERTLRVSVAPPLTDRILEVLLREGGGLFVNQMVWLAWLERLVSDERHLLGQDRLLEIERRLDLELAGVRYWGSLEPAPVDDWLQLGTEEQSVPGEEVFHGKRICVLRIPDAAVDADGRIPLPGLCSEESNELLLGIRAPSHVYLNVGRRRFDGDIFRPLRVREKDYAYPGVLIRFVDVPVKSLLATRRTLEWLSGRERRTLTCAHSACALIGKSAAMRIDDHSELRPFLPSHVLPTRTIRKIIEWGVRDHLGRPISYQVYKADSRPVEEILAEMRREEIRIAWDHARLLTIDVWRKSAAWLRDRVARR